MADIRITDSTNDLVVSFYDSNAVKQVETLTIPATASAAQGDYVVLTNKLNGETVAVWLDINNNGTAPTGALYLASDYQVEVDIATGGSSATNATAFAAALALETAWASAVSIVDNEDGTVTITQGNAGVVAAAVPKNTGDTGAGSITATTDTAGISGSVDLVIYFPKTGLMVIQDERNQRLWLVDEYEDYRTGRGFSAPYGDINTPTSTSLADLVSQLIILKN